MQKIDSWITGGCPFSTSQAGVQESRRPVKEWEETPTANSGMKFLLSHFAIVDLSPIRPVKECRRVGHPPAIQVIVRERWLLTGVEFLHEIFVKDKGTRQSLDLEAFAPSDANQSVKALSNKFLDTALRDSVSWTNLFKTSSKYSVVKSKMASTLSCSRRITP